LNQRALAEQAGEIEPPEAIVSDMALIAVPPKKQPRVKAPVAMKVRKPARKRHRCASRV
jgi:hypothetical protein